MGYCLNSDPPLLVLKVVFAKVNANARCAPNLKSLASPLAEISRGLKNFCDAPLDYPPVKFGPKVVLAAYSPNPSCVPNMQSLDLTIAEISWRPPPILVLKLLFASYSRYPSCEKVCSTCASMMTGT